MAVTGSGRRWTRCCAALVPRRARRRDGRPVPRALPRPRVAPTPACCPARARRSPPYAAHGGRIVVVTGKYAPNAQLHLDHLGLDVDELVGLASGAPGKGEALRRARRRRLRRRPRPRRRGRPAAGAAERRGAHRRLHARDELRAAGADVVLDDLPSFPAWLDEHLLRPRLARLERAAARARLGARRLQRRRRLAPSCSPRRSARSGPTTSSPRPPSPTRCPPSELGRRPRLRRRPRRAPPDPARPTRWSARATAPTPATAATSARPSCSTCSARWPTRTGSPHVATGTNADDAVAGFRPGIRAAAERGAVTPLRDAGLTKAQVRAASRRLGPADLGQAGRRLPVQPDRLRHRGHPDRLARVERAEAALRRRSPSAGIEVRDLRVRDLGEPARVEVDADRGRRRWATAPRAARRRAGGRLRPRSRSTRAASAPDR